MSGFNSYQTIRHADKQVYELFDSAYNKNMSHYGQNFSPKYAVI